MRRGTGRGGVLPPLGAAGGWGVPAGVPRSWSRPRGRSGPSALAAEVPGPPGPRGSSLPGRAPGSRLPGLRRALPPPLLVSARGESQSPPPRALPHPSSPALVLRCLRGTRAGPALGVHPADLGCTSGDVSGISSVTHGTPLVSPGRRGVGLHPDLGKCLQFLLPELGALCPPLRFLGGTGCVQPAAGDAALFTRERIPALGLLGPPPFSEPPFRMVPRLLGSALFPGRGSLRLGAPCARHV